MTLRIASLLPSATEIVAALGAADELVARSHECDWPAGLERLPVMTEARLDASGPSAAIHARMKDALRDALSVYRVDAQGLEALAPDVVVTQSQCEVCAVSEDDVRAAMDGWGDHGARLVSLTAADLAGVYGDIARVAEALGRTEVGEAVIAAMKVRLEDIASRAAAAPARPRLLVVEWIDPPMAGGNWMPELVAIAGAENLLSEAGQPSSWIAWDDIRDADPDVIVVCPCGFDIARAEADMGALTGRPGWGDLGAVKAEHVAIADGNWYFNRPGPRLVETAEILAEILHPETFDFGWQGTGWRWFSG